LDDPQVRAIVGSLERLEQELAAREREIDALRGQRRDAAPPGSEGRRPGDDARGGGSEPGSPGPGGSE
jgi:hypothetical protein